MFVFKNVLPIFDNTNTFLQRDEPVIHIMHSVLQSQFLPICNNTNTFLLRDEPVIHIMHSVLQSQFLPIFDNTNTFLQRYESVIHIMHSVLQSQLTDLLVRFVKPVVIVRWSKVQKVEFNQRENQLDDKELFVSEDVQKCISNNAKKRSATTMSQFFKSVRTFYEQACNYMIAKYPYDDPMLQHCQVLNVLERHNHDFKSFMYFVKRFKCLLNSDNGDTVDMFHSQFLRYQVDDLPKYVVEAERIDVSSHALSLVKDQVAGQPKYTLLANVAKEILTMYPSNADCERLFSIVRKKQD